MENKTPTFLTFMLTDLRKNRDHKGESILRQAGRGQTVSQSERRHRAQCASAQGQLSRIKEKQDKNRLLLSNVLVRFPT